mgnify:CR=1 FL=1
MAQSPSGKYKPGDQVRIRVGIPLTHFRTPEYVQGKQGEIETSWGAYPNPEGLAYGSDGLPAQPLYLVKFAQTDLWTNYEGSAKAALLLNIYENRLQ